LKIIKLKLKCIEKVAPKLYHYLPRQQQEIL